MQNNIPDRENHYFDADGFYAMTVAGYSWAASPPDALRVAPPPHQPGKWPRINNTGDGWDLVDDHFDVDAWLNGKSRRIDYHGPLRAGWSLMPPEAIRSPMEVRRIEIITELENLDRYAIRPMHSMLSGTATMEDEIIVASLEDRKNVLRTELSNLSS